MLGQFVIRNNDSVMRENFQSFTLVLVLLLFYFVAVQGRGKL